MSRDCKVFENERMKENIVYMDSKNNALYAKGDLGGGFTTYYFDMELGVWDYFGMEEKEILKSCVDTDIPVTRYEDALSLLFNIKKRQELEKKPEKEV